jgi:predicted DNA-binding transcriptional regulator AlpA
MATHETLHRLLSPKRAAALLGISIASFYRLCKNDQSFPPRFPISANRVAVDEADLLLWIEQRKALIQKGGTL